MSSTRRTSLVALLLAGCASAPIDPSAPSETGPTFVATSPAASVAVDPGCEARAAAFDAKAATASQEGRLEASLRRLDEAVAACPASASSRAPRRLELLAALGRCDELALVTGASDAQCAAAKRACAEAAAETSASLMERAATVQGAAAARLWDRARSALERETGAPARLVDEPFSRRWWTAVGAKGAVAAGDGYLVRADAAAPSVRWRIEKPPFDDVRSLVADGSKLLVERGDDLELRDLATLAVERTFQGYAAFDVADLSNDLSRLLLGSYSGDDTSRVAPGFRLIDAATGQVLANEIDTFDSSGQGLHSAELMPVGPAVVAQFQNRGIVVLDGRNGRRVLAGPHEGPAFSDDYRYLLACTDDSPAGRYVVLDLVTLARGRGDGLPCVAPTFVDQHRIIPVRAGGDRVGFLDVATGKRLGEEPTPQEVAPTASTTAFARAASEWRPEASPEPRDGEQGRTIVGKHYVDLSTGRTEPCDDACKRSATRSTKPRAWGWELPDRRLTVWALGPDDVAIARDLGSSHSGGDAARLVLRGSKLRGAFFCRFGDVGAPLEACEGRFVTPSLDEPP